MIRFRCILLLIAVLTLVGCHRKKETAPKSHRTDTCVVAEEGGRAKEEATVKPAEDKGTTLQLQADSAISTDWRKTANKGTKIYSPSLLAGTWKRGSLQHKYRANGTGSRWDEGEDVDYGEAQTFVWTMDSNCLTLVFAMQLGGVVPKEYVVTYLDEESLVYKDAYGNSYMWDKVPEGIERVEH